MLDGLRKLFARKVWLSGNLPNSLTSRRVTPEEEKKIQDRHTAIRELIDTTTKIDRAYQQATEIEDAGKSNMAGFPRLYEDVLNIRAGLCNLASCHINFPEDKDYREAWKNTVLEAAIIRGTMKEYHAEAFPKPAEEPKAPDPSGKKGRRHLHAVADSPKPQDPAAG